MITVLIIKFIFFYAQEKTTQSILRVFSVKSIQEILDVEKQKVVEDCVKIMQVKTKIGQIKTKIVQIKIKIVLEMQAQPKVRLPDFRKR